MTTNYVDQPVGDKSPPHKTLRGSLPFGVKQPTLGAAQPLKRSVTNPEERHKWVFSSDNIKNSMSLNALQRRASFLPRRNQVSNGPPRTIEHSTDRTRPRR